MTSPAYTFAAEQPLSNKPGGKKGKHHKRGTPGKHHHQQHQLAKNSYDDADDGGGSLTYSAASSVHSGGSATGESTDSSFADIMRVLDMQDSKELAALCKKEGVSSAGELKSRYNHRRNGGGSAVSVTSSLNYSTDGESHLEGSQLLQTIAGQPSDSYAFDGGSSQHARGAASNSSAGAATSEEQPISDNDILFAPAAPADSHSKRKKDKERKRAERAAAAKTPKSKNSAKSASSPTSSPEASPLPAEPPKSATPPPLPPKGFVEEDDDEDIWYAKWWMSCFADSFKNLVPKK